ncbi:MAG: hypothetical protein IKP49_12555 [Treponema sp.]|nr:hypothetical protein [Treponema sp.]MBR6913207.1 hypothetical protein [Treponema sp.]
MKITITIDSDELMKYTRRIAICLCAVAFLLFLILSAAVFKFSLRRPDLYSWNYQQMTAPGQIVASSMRKTGEVEDSVLNNKNAFRNTKKKNEKNAFFDSVSRNHKDDK